MTSGRKLTKHEVAEILRLAGLERDNGDWLLSVTAIATRLGVHRRTISRHIRHAAVRYGEQTKPGQSHFALSNHDD